MFDHCLYFNTAALARLLERNWAEAYRPLGLTAPQGFLLRAVLRRPGILQGELAKVLSLSRPTVTRALDGLAAHQLVRRKASDADGREVAIHPTAAALELQNPLDRASASASTRIRRVIGDGPFAELVAGVRGARSALE